MGQAELPGRAFALTETENQMQKLYAVCPRASALGLTKGMTLAEARAIRPDIVTDASNPERDAKKLEGLARWLVRYTPLTAVDDTIGNYCSDGILLDITGCAHLFGGERAMLTDIEHRLEHAGIRARMAIAESRSTAWALARYYPAEGSMISKTSAESTEMLANLPVRALRLDSGSELTLHRLGLKSIGSLLKLPRSALAQRFRGRPSKEITALLTRLDQVSGRYDEPVSPLTLLPSWRVQQTFSEPVQHRPQIDITIKALVNKLASMLAEAEQAARRLALQAFRVDGSLQEIIIGTNRPSRDKAHLTRLLLEKTDTLEAEFGFDLLMLNAFETEHLPPVQTGNASAQHSQSASELLDRLSIRLGPQAIGRLKHRESHLPERTQTLAPAHEKRLGWDKSFPNTAPRPLRLLLRPEVMDVLAEVPEGAPRRFLWRRTEHRTTKAEGPERIACEWWINPEAETRDYYRVEVIGGARFWVFRYGLYGVNGVRHASNSKPAWYMHGFFA